jgi:hypothetical protein
MDHGEWKIWPTILQGDELNPFHVEKLDTRRNDRIPNPYRHKG